MNCADSRLLKNHHWDMLFSPVRIILCILFLSQVILASPEWADHCEPCSCAMKDSKKTADCTNKNYNNIPKHLDSSVQHLDLSNNVIAELTSKIFSEENLIHLHNLDMKNCTLQEIHRNALEGLSVLIYLDFSNNQIKRLEVGMFNTLIKLRKFVANNNQIEVLPTYLFRDLKYLTIVQLKNNRINRIEDKTFYTVPKLEVIYLESNQLSILNTEPFEKLTLKELTIEDNPWNCTCDLRVFRDFIVKEKLHKMTTCYDPPRLLNKKWSDTVSEDFACQPQIIKPEAGASVDATSDNITLTCKIRAWPKPDIFWLHNKREINKNERRLTVRYVITGERQPNNLMHTSELGIRSVKASDKGVYTCVARNIGGTDEAELQLAVSANKVEKGVIGGSSSNFLITVCIIALVILLIFILLVLIICWYCRRSRKIDKNAALVESSLITSKLEKGQNGSMIEGGSVILEMQKSLLTEVNPVEKPPRRADIEATDTEDGHDMKKTLLDETSFGNHDEETHSIALSDTTPRSRQTFVDDGYGTNLPPDLLAFPARVPQSPSLQGSLSNIPDSRLYCKSPLSSPVYQHVVAPGGIYGTTPTAFRTLQHPKNRNVVLTNVRNSPFIPAPVVYPPVVMKQGYMTIPRKPRTPSWTPSNTTTLSEFLPASSSCGTSTSEAAEPVYDNLGLRTTAGGNSLLNLNKIGNSQTLRYTMKDRPLPATPNTGTPTGPAPSTAVTIVPATTSSGAFRTPATAPTNTSSSSTKGHSGHPKSLNSNSSYSDSINSSKIYEPIHELLNPTMTSETEPLYGTAKGNHMVTIVPSSLVNGTLRGSRDKISKVPPRPPPKPKKKMSVTSNGQGSTSQLFEDEGEDGTEV